MENLINDLPNSAFVKRNKRKVLLKKIDATFNQLEAGAYRGAQKKLKNDIENKITKWIVASSLTRVPGLAIAFPFTINLPAIIRA